MAETQDLQKLIVSLEARTTAFEKQMKRAADKAAQSTRAIENRFAAMNRNIVASQASAVKSMQASFASLGGSIRATAGLFGVGIGLQTITDLVNKFDELGDVADRTGVSVEHLQAAMKLAEKTGSSGSTLLAGIDRFNTLLGEGAAKANDLTKFLELNGVALRNQDGTLRTTEELWRDYLDLIGRFHTEAGRAGAVSDTLGPKFDELGQFAKTGAAGVDAMQVSMASLGQLVSDEAIRKIGSYKDALADISSSSIAEAAKILVELAEALKEVNAAVEAGIKFLGGGGEQKSITDPNFTIGPFPSRHLPILEGDTSVRGSEAADALNNLRTSIQGVEEEIRNLESTSLEDSVLPPGEAFTVQQQALAALREELAMLREEYALTTGAARETLTPPATAPPGTVPATGPVEGTVSRQGFENRFDPLDETLDDLEKLEEVKTDLAQPEPLMPAAADDLDDVGDAAKKTTIEVHELRDSFAEVRSLSEDWANTFVDGILDGKSAVEALADALEELGRSLIRSGIHQIVGAIFPTPGAGAPLFAAGGNIYPGNVYKVHRDETIIPRIPGKVIPASKSGGGGDVFNISMGGISVAGNADENVLRLAQEKLLRDVQDHLPAMIRKAHSNRTL